MSVIRADAMRIPLADASVDLIVTSPPYESGHFKKTEQRTWRDRQGAML